MSSVSPLFSHILDLVFPPLCTLCGKAIARGPICPTCWAKARPIVGPMCIRCGIPVASAKQGGDASVYRCQTCRQKSWAFDRARSGYIFEGPVREAIHLLKYQGRIRIGTWLGKRMAEVCSLIGDGCGEGVLVPVPLNVERLREREFNQSLTLAKSLAKAFRLPMRPLLLERKGGSTPQVGLSPEDRWANVRGAFAVRVDKGIRGKGIILVDDVFTTGATANECARVLKKAGARRVEVWTLARAV